MADEYRSNQRRNPKQKPPKSKSATSHIDNISGDVNNLPNTEVKQKPKDESCEHQDGIKLPITEVKFKFTDKIAIYNIVVNALLAIITGFLYYIATKSLDETRREFGIINKPFLQVEVIRSNPFVVGKPIGIDLSIKNIGSFRAKVTSLKVAYKISQSTPDFFVTNSKNSLKGNVYVTKETPIYFPTNDIFPTTITQKMLDSIRQPGAVLFIESHIEYENPVNEKRGYCNTILIIDYKVIGAHTAYLLNDSEEEK